jgi:hypothetical protein
VDDVRRIADAVLYEGYLLWPYRRSATKNLRRWTFGGVFPPAWTRAHEDDACWIEAQCLVEGDAAARVSATLRCLHVVDRRVHDGARWVDELTVAGERHLAWEEAAEREVTVGPWALGALDAPHGFQLVVSAASEREDLREAGGHLAGAVVRAWEGLHAGIESRASSVGDGLWRLTVRVTNRSTAEPADRTEALRHALVSTHLVLRSDDAAFVSATDPPAGAPDCTSTGTWPVLVGDAHTMLCAPIILPDHPQIAPESPGDLFDATEIDGLLIASTLALSDAEREEMRDCDPRARAILERCAGLSAGELGRLNGGAIRDLRRLATCQPGRGS